jgi:hypothetical protein
MYYAMVLTLFVALGAIIWAGARRIQEQQKPLNAVFETTTDMKACPVTTKFFSDFQTSFNVWPFATASAATVAVIMLVVLLVIKKLDAKSGLSDVYVVLLTIVILLLAFAVQNKVLICVLYRMCGQGNCAKHFLTTK